MIYYVCCEAGKNGIGTEDMPFRAIQEAAEIANPGDEVIVKPGIYRESVRPRNAGTREKPIAYRAQVPGKSIITGAERIKRWEKYEGNVWVAKIQNGVFGSYNPYTTLLYGDWYYTQEKLHTGEVYLNDKSMYEVTDIEKIKSPKPFAESNDKEFSVYQWYTCQEENATVIYANFQGKDPNNENVEINVRRNCFYPDRTGINYITLSGFVMNKAATTWAPPTAYQEGLVGPHWSKGWIIEDCEISESKCVGISLGKYLQPYNDNKWTKTRYKQGAQTERDVICQAQAEGWSKEKIGSHTVRRCHIHDCGQAGIVGHLGCVFSSIQNNHIHHINWKHSFAGAEIGGIKLHAAIDTQIEKNHIHHCTRGLWLDWQAQGTRVSKNLFHDNCPPEDTEKFHSALDIGEDLFIEVSHGPTMVDHNILLSPNSCRFATQGVAFVHNLICGAFTSVGSGTTNTTGGIRVDGKVKTADVEPRYTPYHIPHRTEVGGFMTILHGDDRFYNNIFVQNHSIGCMDNFYAAIPTASMNSEVGLAVFDEFPTWEEYDSLFFIEGDEGLKEDRSKYFVKLPIYASGNIYFNGASAWKKEINANKNVVDRVFVAVKEIDNGYILDSNLKEYLPKEPKTGIISTQILGEAFEPEQRFENPDGTEILLDRDYHGNKRGLNPIPGPFETAKSWEESCNLDFLIW